MVIAIISDVFKVLFVMYFPHKDQGREVNGAGYLKS
jgi:hypothetical protein